MRIKFILTAALFACLMSLNVRAQDEKTALDRYIDTAKTIIIAKCLSRTPVTRGGSYGAQVEILHVVKGTEKKREITVTLKFVPIDVGKIYLLRNEYTSDSSGDDYPNYFLVKGIDSAIEIADYEDIEKLKALPVRIIVLRTMNTRKDHLESEIRRRNYELDLLKQITKGQ